MRAICSNGTEPSQGGRLRPAVFLDRDGTLIEDRGDLRCPSNVAFFPETVDALRMLQRRFSLFIVTNQSGVSKGVLTLQDVERVNKRIVSHLTRAGVRIIATYVCPHQRSDGCACIKPNPYFLLKAARQYGVDLQRSFVIGDHPSDMQLACNTGASGIYVLTGHGGKHHDELRHGDIVVSGILEAADWILAQPDAMMDGR